MKFVPIVGVVAVGTAAIALSQLLPLFRHKAPSGPQELSLTVGSPVLPEYPLSDQIAGEPLHSFAYDLNSDGVPEYFVADMVGADGANFVLLDTNRKSLLEFPDSTSDKITATTEPSLVATDEGSIGGEAILILESRHNGYFDLLSIDDALDGQTWTLWTFANGYYSSKPFDNHLKFSCLRGLHAETASDGEIPKVRAYWGFLY